MPRLRRKERADYAPEYVPEEEEPVPEEEDVTPALTETSEPSDSDIAPGDEGLLGDSEKQANIYVSHSTYEKPIKEKPSEPVPEHPLQEHKHLVLDDLVDDDGGQVLGAELAEIYQSRSTYVLEPTPPKEPHPTRHRRRTIDDISPDDKELIDETHKTIYESESTYDVGEIGSVVLESAEKLISKAKKTARETAIVSHSERIFESDDLDDPEGIIEEQLGEIYESHSTYEVEKTVDATGLYLTGLALSGGVSFIRGATYAVNPLEWARGAHDLTYLARSRYAQKEFAENVAEDPLRFLVDIGAATVGGYYTMKGLTNLAGKLGLIDPSDMKLVQKTMPIEDAQIGVNPSTLMKRGKWRKTWEITRQGGTAILGLVDEPGMVQVWTPVPVFTSKLKNLGAVTGLLSGIAPDIDDPLGKEKLDTIQKSIPTTIDDMVDETARVLEMVDESYKQEKDLIAPITIIDPIVKTKKKTWIQPGYIQRPDIIPDVVPDIIQDPIIDPIIDSIPIQDPIIDQTTDIIQDLTQVQEQIQEPVQEQMLYTTQIQKTKSLSKNILRSTRKQRKKKNVREDPPFGFEKKKYDILSAKQLRGLGLKSTGEMPKGMLLKGKRGALDKSTGKTPKELLLKRKKGRIDLL